MLTAMKIFLAKNTIQRSTSLKIEEMVFRIENEVRLAGMRRWSHLDDAWDADGIQND